MNSPLRDAVDGATICAISTAPGAGGIAVIRISGTNALTLGSKVFSKPLALSKLDGVRGLQDGVFYAPVQLDARHDSAPKGACGQFDEGRTGEQAVGQRQQQQR